jgi:CubicO group peptidase (beta-lactamase class C family)
VIDGFCDPAFAGVRDVLAAALAAGDDLGAAVAVFADGRCVADLWGGVADDRAGRPWLRDTPCVTFSATKAVTAVAALLLAERGRLAVDVPVADYWPEFAAHGKDGVSVEHVLSHQAGLPSFDRPMTVEEAADPGAMAAQLAGQAPEWRPGTAHGYHALTFGWLVGELIRRVDGRPVGRFVREELAAELEIGVPEGRLPALARLVAGRPMKPDDLPTDLATVARVVAAAQDPSSPMQRSTANPPASFNKPAVLTAGWPAAGLVCTARALADFYRRLVDGSLLGRAAVGEAIRERVRGPDRTLVSPTAFGLGFMRPAANMWLPPAARASAFGHPGASGALGLGDLEAGIAFAYVPNLTRPALGDRRAYRLVDATYAALG